MIPATPSAEDTLRRPAPLDVVEELPEVAVELELAEVAVAVADPAAEDPEPPVAEAPATLVEQLVELPP